MSIKKGIAGVMIFLLATAAGYYGYATYRADDGLLRIYGTVDRRTVNVAFEQSGRIEEVVFEEGATVKAGDVLASLDAENHSIALSNGLAQLGVAQKNLELLLAGSRKEDIEVARANVKALDASYRLAVRTCEREKKLGAASSKQRLDQACSEARVARAQTKAAQKQLDRLLAGTRVEEIEVARAQVMLAQSVVDQAEKALRDTVLKAPVAGVVRSRNREKGDMVTPSTAVYELAVMNPVWIRAWVDEVNLGKVSPGQKVAVRVDSFPEQPLEGTVGFISQVAEFTPKTVQTEDLRTALVYEVRVTLEDPQGILRLGMPATVVIPK